MPAVEIIASSYAPNANNCGLVDITIQTDINFNSVRVNNILSEIAIDTDTYVFSMIRGVDYKFEFYVTGESETFVTAWPTTTFANIPTLIPGHFFFDISATLTEGILKINKTFSSVLFYEYSINNGVSWRTSSVFNNLPLGPGTLLIRDKIFSTLLGCEISIPYTIEIVKTKKEFINISKANPFFFVKLEIENDVNIFNNRKNSFSITDKSTVNYCNEALVNKVDQSRVQIKSSYNNHSVLLKSESGIEYPLITNKRTDNLERFKAYDSIVDSYDENKIILYFNYGNEYNDNYLKIGTHSFNGNLPDFSIIGQIIQIEGYGAIKISDIIYLDSINRNCLVFDTNFIGNEPSVVIASSTYNALPFDIFDFDIIWALYPVGTYEIEITSTDDSFLNDVVHVSENINLQEKHRDSIFVMGYNENNRDIFYKYNMRPSCRFNVLNISTLIIDNIENNITDDNIQVVKSTLNEGIKISFEEMTREAIVKLCILLSCEFVFIDGMRYVKSDSVSIEDVEGTNLQGLTVQMIETGINYNNLIESEEGIDSDSIDLDIPAFVISNTNFIKL